MSTAGQETLIITFHDHLLRELVSGVRTLVFRMVYVPCFAAPQRTSQHVARCTLRGA